MAKMKLKYFNLNIIQLIGKGKLKKQYNEQFKLSKIVYSRGKQKVKTFMELNGVK